MCSNAGREGKSAANGQLSLIKDCVTHVAGSSISVSRFCYRSQGNRRRLLGGYHGYRRFVFRKTQVIRYQRPELFPT